MCGIAGVWVRGQERPLYVTEHRDQLLFANNDNMGLVGVLSTQLLHRELVRQPITPAPLADPLVIDRLADRT